MPGKTAFAAAFDVSPYPLDRATPFLRPEARARPSVWAMNQPSFRRAIMGLREVRAGYAAYRGRIACIHPRAATWMRSWALFQGRSGVTKAKGLLRYFGRIRF